MPFVPLILSPGFNPSGWLGLLKGQRLYFDFSNPHAFDNALAGVFKEIDRAQSGKLPAVSVPTASTPTTAAASDGAVPVASGPAPMALPVPVADASVSFS